MTDLPTVAPVDLGSGVDPAPVAAPVDPTIPVGATVTTATFNNANENAGTHTSVTYTIPAAPSSNPWPSRLRVFNAMCGGILAASGAITAYFNTLGTGSRWVSIALGGIGVLQVVVADITTALS